jgi:hypothetical protein
VTFQTHSPWVVKEWDTMVQWRVGGYEGLQSSDVLNEWHRNMVQVERDHKRIQVSVGTGAHMVR